VGLNGLSEINSKIKACLQIYIPLIIILGKHCEMLNLNYTDSIKNLDLEFRRCDLTPAFQHCQKYKVEQKKKEDLL